VLFETGDKDYYWLNNVVAVGKLSSVEDKSARKEGESFFLRIDVWHVSFSVSVSHALVVAWGSNGRIGFANNVVF
jgi:hypothetical protein